MRIHNHELCSGGDYQDRLLYTLVKAAKQNLRELSSTADFSTSARYLL